MPDACGVTVINNMNIENSACGVIVIKNNNIFYIFAAQTLIN